MKHFSLKTKISIMLLAGLTLVFAVIVTVNHSRQKETTTELYEHNLEDQQWSLNNQIEVLMVTAENDRLQPLVEEMAARGMVEELQVIDADKKIARASDPTQIGNDGTDPVWSAVFASGRDSVLFRTVNGEEIEYSYTILHNETACQDCHDESEAILGGVKTVSSRQILADSLNQAFWTNVWVSLVGGLILLGSLMFVLYREIFRPLTNVQAKLAAASKGDTSQDVATDRRDEIGSLLQDIQHLIVYIRDYATVACSVSSGDLTADIPVRSERDQLGRAFAEMCTSLDRIIKELRANAGDLVSAAGSTAGSAEQMSRSSSSQTQQIEQISTGVEQMVVTITSSSQHAQNANEIAGRASTKATEGRRIVTDTVTGMHAIREVVQQTAQSVTELSKSAEDIGTVTQVIDEIADQTNLLALNAAIEAARAGEQGRGFAVVADEVRKLADQTRKATQEIAEKIKGIQYKTTSAVTEMEGGITRVAEGAEQAEKAGESLEEIVMLAEQVSGMIAQIAHSAEEQNAVAQDIAKSMGDISNSARDVASGATNSAGVAEQLNGQADSLQQLVQQFKVRG